MPSFLTARPPVLLGEEVTDPSSEDRRRLTNVVSLPPVLVSFLRFALVGTSGVVVNLAVLAAVLRLPGGAPGPVRAAVAETLATQVAILWNFGMTEVWVFARDRAMTPRWLRLGGYWLVSMLTLAVQLPLAAAIAYVLPLGYVLATALALLALVLGRYLVCRLLIYRRSVTASVSTPGAARMGLEPAA